MSALDPFEKLIREEMTKLSAALTVTDASAPHGVALLQGRYAGLKFAMDTYDRIQHTDIEDQ
jgi:hypothetical protein